jgi:ribosomal protein L7/L12
MTIRIYLSLACIVVFLLPFSFADEALKKIGNFEVPNNIKMRSYTTEKNYEDGNYKVTITSIPTKKLQIIKYMWLENLNAGLRKNKEKLDQIPSIVFSGVSIEDSIRMVENLVTLGANANFSPLAK